MQFFEPDPKIEILFEKERAAEETNVNFEIGLMHLLQNSVVENLIQSLSVFFLFGHLKRKAYLSVIWLPHSKRWAIIKSTATATQC